MPSRPAALSTRVFVACALWLAGPRDALARPALCAELSPFLQKTLAQDAAPSGKAVDLLVDQAIHASCSEAAGWLPSTCGAPLGAGALAELRRRLLADAASLPSRATAGSERPALSLRLVGALLSAALTSGDLEGLAWALARSSAHSSPLCPRSKGAGLAPLAAASDPLDAAASLLARLASGAGEEQLSALVRDLETRQGEPLSASSRGQLEQLTRAASALRSAPPPAEATRFAEQARELGRALELAVQITSRRAITLPPGISAMIEHLARGNASALLLDALALATEASGPVPPSAVEAMRLASSLAEVRSEDDLRRKLRGLILPWSAPWLFDINASVPRLEDREGGSLLSLFGDLSLGYQGERWGAVGRGMFSLYNLRETTRFLRNYRALGDVEGWMNFGLSRGLRAEVRLSAGVTGYGTRHDDLTLGQFRLDRETSIVARGTVLGALRATPTSTLAAGLWLGLGGQYEDYRSRALASLADQGITDQHALSAAFEARFRLQWSVIPGWLGLRARADLVRFSITRDSSNFTVNTEITSTTTRTTATQLDLNARLFLDLDALGFFGFLPSAHAGLDLYQQTASGQPLRSTIPLAGLGLRRETF